MTGPPYPELVERLRRAELLTPQQWDEEPTLTGPFETPAAYADALVKRGWLTSFQATYLINDKLDDLVLDGYRLLEPIGTGGQGEVFRALQVNLNRPVALKRLRMDSGADPDALCRLKREALAVARLAHPNIVHIYNVGQVKDTHYIVMEYVKGTDLARLVRDRGALPVPVACDYIRQAALGLQHAHENGLIHRDVKPSNLLVAMREGDCPAGTDFGLVKLLDLGLARLTNGTDPKAPVLTRLRSVVGTPDYMSPEQARDSTDIDHRADLYSLGCTFYFLLAGQPPFPDGTSMEKMIMHQFERPKPLSETRRGVPAGVLSMLGRLMRKTVENRYQTAAEAAEALSQFLGNSHGRRADWPGVTDQEPPLTSKPPTEQCEPQLVTKPPSANTKPDASVADDSLAAGPPAPATPALELMSSTSVSGLGPQSYPSVSLLLRGAGPKPAAPAGQAAPPSLLLRAMANANATPPAPAVKPGSSRIPSLAPITPAPATPSPDLTPVSVPAMIPAPPAAAA